MQQKSILKYIILSAAFIIFSSSMHAKADTLARSPYIQRVSPTQAIIRWRTVGVSDSVVLYGTSQGTVVSRAEDSTSTTEHRVEISGLSPDTRYFYSVGSSAERLTNNDGTYYFNTSPTNSKNTRVWVLGDSGRGNADAFSVKQGYLNFIGNDGRKADLWLMLGDNAYFNGLDNEYQTGLFNVYPEILKNTVLWPTLGNHDGSAKNFVVGEIPYYATFSLPRNAEAGGTASGTESYYSFEYGDIHFICLNSYDEDRSSTAAMAKWLQDDLSANSKKWTIAFWHHPPYTKGTHDSDTEIELIEMRERILPILENHGVDLVLTGHSHNYERSFLVDSHYGLSSTFNTDGKMKIDGSSGALGYNKPPQTVAHQGTVYVVNGTGSAVGGGSLNHPVFYTNKSALGSMILDISSDELHASFITSSGNTEDYFEIKRPVSAEGVSQQKILFGKLNGKSSSLTASDNNGINLTPSYNRKSRKYLFRADFKISAPKTFYRRTLKLRAGKKTSTSQNIIISVSTDGIRFSKLATIKTVLKNSAFISKVIDGSGAGEITIRVESPPTSNAPVKGDGAKIDYLTLSNE